MAPTAAVAAALVVATILALGAAPAAAEDPFAGLTCELAAAQLQNVILRSSKYNYYRALFFQTMPSHINDWGSQSACHRLSGMKFCRVYSNHRDGWGSTVRGRTSICIPSVCNSTEVLGGNLQTLLFGRFAPADLDIYRVRCFNSHPENPRGEGAYLTIILLSFVAFFCAAGSLLTFLGYDTERSSDKSALVASRRLSFIEMENLRAVAGADGAVESPPSRPVASGLAAHVVHFLLYFSLAKNWVEFCKMPRHPRDLKVLDGLKVLSMVWVIIGHVLLWTSDNIERESYYKISFYDTTRWYWQLVRNAFPAVDTFFFAGGFLALHFIVKHQKKEEQLSAKAKSLGGSDTDSGKGSDTIELKFMAGTTGQTIDMDELFDGLASSSTDGEDDDTMATSVDPEVHSHAPSQRTGALAVLTKSLFIYLHRWLRLTPVYGLTILYYVNLAKYASFGYQWERSAAGRTDSNCLHNWWTNMLYINNLYPNQFIFDENDRTSGDQCMAWSWYLAVDFQLFLFVVPMGLLFLRHRRAMYIGTLVAILAILSIRAALTTSYNLGTCNPNPKASEFSATYIKPYARGIPYFAGMLLAMMYHDGFAFLRNAGFFVRAAWNLVTVAILFGSLLGQTDSRYQSGLQVYNCRWNEEEGNAYYILLPLGWSIGLFMLGWGMIQGWRTWINQFLSWSVFVFCSRLIYGAYLIHPIVIQMFTDTQDVDSNYSGETLFMYMIALVVISFFASMVMYLTVEMPFMHLTKALLAKRVR